MTEHELFNAFESQKTVLDAWGTYIKNYVYSKLDERDLNTSNFLKVPCVVRVKETKSFIEKALYRPTKQYRDPINDITDKVGIRFIVLFSNEIQIIDNIITECDTWCYSLDRDFETEREERPELFTYQSVHYVVRNKHEQKFNNITVPTGTACEIQVRTLLQHAYAELSHDAVYKAKEQIPQESKRKIARSMALIEATDELFKEVKVILDKEDMLYNDIISKMKLYVSNDNFVEKMNKFIFDAYKAFIKEKEITSGKIIDYITKENPDVLQAAEANEKSHNLLRKQPISILIYYLALKHKNICKAKWPLTESELRMLFNDVGVSLDY